LILLYNKYHEHIGPVRTLQYWVNLLNHSEYADCHAFVLQFLISILSVSEEHFATG